MKPAFLSHASGYWIEIGLSIWRFMRFMEISQRPEISGSFKEFLIKLPGFN